MNVSKKKGVEIQPVRSPTTYNTTEEEQPPMGERIGEYPKDDKYREILWFNFIVLKGKVSDIMRIITYLQSKFETIELELIASEGRISDQELEDKVKEAFQTVGY